MPRIKSKTASKNNSFPRVIAFCCEHSGYLAAQTAERNKYLSSENLALVQYPCTGRIEPGHILKAFENGWDGVAILACHQGACKYLKGNIRAGKRVTYTRKLLQEAGIEPERLKFFNLSSGQWKEFARITEDMMKQIGGIKL